MDFYLLPIIIIVVSNVCYHISQKNINQNINPFISLIITYLAGIIVAVIFYIFSEKGKNLPGELAKINFFTVFLGIAIVGLEAGYLLAYRANWPMSIAVILTNATATLALIPIGIIVFKEQFSLSKLLGIMLCIGGLFLLNLKNK